MADNKNETEEKRLKAQRARNLAIGWGLAALVAVFYFATWFKLG